MNDKKPDTFTAEVIGGRRITIDKTVAEIWGIIESDILEVKICGIHKRSGA